MTVHAAKGLEFPLTLDPAAILVDVEEAVPVFIMGPGRCPGSPPDGIGEHVYSASEIEHYLRGPRVSRVPRFSAAPDPITRYLGLHFCGMDAGR